MCTILNDFLKAKINLKQLKEKLGSDLYNVAIKTPKKVYANDLILIINQYISGKISLQEIVDWVNVVWFTDLYEYNESEEETIASVLFVLETLDENDADITEEDLKKMIKCLTKNDVYEFK